jgi:Acetyl-CoA acetyltransferase
MKAIMFAAQSIQLGLLDVAIAGGMESMSNIPYYVPKARFGYKFGNSTLVDGLVRDGLQDVYDENMMGVSADATAAKYNFSREDQDAYAIESYKRSAKATSEGKFKSEITPVNIETRKGTITVSEDEEYKKVIFEKVPKLRPAFGKNGTVTAANASTINDGAAAVVLMSGAKVKALGLEPVARIVSFADAAHEPQWFTTAPTKAAPIAIERAGISKNEIGCMKLMKRSQL